jgi:transcriptional regulator with XRE-family HTH domain
VRDVADKSAPTLTAVIGLNCKRIRTDIGVTQEELARHARAAGLRWTASIVGDFEAGRHVPTFATVLAVTRALHSAFQDAPKNQNKRPAGGVTLADLVTGDGFVALNENIDVLAARLSEVCRGQAFTLGKGNWRTSFRPMEGGVVTDLVDTLRRSGLTEQRLAQRLGIGTEHLAVLSSRLWHRTFSEERDRRAGADANRQKRGQVTRELQRQLEKEITDGNN